MTRDAANLSTEYQPKGSGLNPSDTLDKPAGPTNALPSATDKSPARPDTPDVVDEKGRPLSGDGLVVDGQRPTR